MDDFRAHDRDTLLGQHLGWVEDLKRFAVATLDENARVTALVEKPQQPPTDIGIFALYLQARDRAPHLPVSGRGQPARRPRPLPRMGSYKRREVGVYLFEGECVDIGTPQAYKEICERFAQK